MEGSDIQFQTWKLYSSKSDVSLSEQFSAVCAQFHAVTHISLISLSPYEMLTIIKDVYVFKNKNYLLMPDSIVFLFIFIASLAIDEF